MANGISTLHCLLLLLILSPSLLQFAVGKQPSNSSSSSVVDEDDYNLDAANVNSSMAVIIIIVVLVFFITGFIALYIHQCSDTSTAGGAQVSPNAGRRGNVRGLDNSVIETFPTFLYSEVKELKIGKGTLECAVCLNEFEEDETLRLLPKCDHVFHSECIDAWLAGHATCPVCRANLIPNPSQNGKADETHDIGSDVEAEGSPSGEGISSGEVRIVIDEGEKKPDRMLIGKLPRSHSTGHSLSQVGGVDSDRYRLKLPAEVRRQLVARTKLNRTRSLVGLPRAPSSRRGYRGGGEGSGSSRYGGGIIGRSISRMVSFKWVPKGRADGDVTEMSRGSNSKRILSSSVTPVESFPSLVAV